MVLRTPLYSEHVRLGARLVPFAGWEMPLHYGSQIQEHQAVRQDAGMFDVSHMRAIDLIGPDALSVLRRLLANDAAKLTVPGKALYSCMLNPAGGVVDDLILFRLDELAYRAVVNAATTAKDLAWMHHHLAGERVDIRPREDLAIIAVQGPTARDRTASCLPEALRARALALAPFHGVSDGDWLVGRTGYTGEDGFEIMLPHTEALALWSALIAAGVRPCGLGARDTLRLEAGLSLYGQDMDESIGPLDAGLAWTVAWPPETRDFIGRQALSARRDHPERLDLVGLLLTGRGVLRAHQPVLLEGRIIGEVTSGGFSPTLERSIGLARITPVDRVECAVEIRGHAVAARIVKPPFVRHGRIRVTL